MKYKNYIFDCGNVLFFFSRDHLLDVFLNDNEDDRKLFYDVVYKNWEKQDYGLSNKEFYELVIKDLPPHMHKASHDVIYRWIEEIKPFEEMIELIKRLKSNGHKIYLLSNMPENYSLLFEKLPILNEFDDLVFSYPLKIAKPQPEIFNYLLNKNNLDKKDCIFVDDSLINIEAAKKIGISGYLFNPQNINEFIDFVEEMENL